MITYWVAAHSTATRAVSGSFGPVTALRETKAAMSGNRWPARLKGRARRARDGDSVFDRVIDGSVGKFDGQCWRRRGERGAHRSSGHADRAEIGGSVVGGVVLRPIAINRSHRRDQQAGTL